MATLQGHMIESAKEMWLPIVKFEGIYEVSNLGRVKRLPHLVASKSKGLRLLSESILKGHTHISRVCKGLAKTAGKYLDGTPIKWYYAGKGAFDEV